MLEKCKGGYTKEEEKNLGILKIPVNIDIFEKLVGTLKKWQCPFFFWQCNTTLFYLLQSLNQKQTLKTNNNNKHKETNKQKNNYHVFLLRMWMSQLKFPNALFHVIFIIYLVWVVPRHTGKGNYWTHWNCNFTVISACSQGHALKDNRESWA